jgi:transketolase
METSMRAQMGVTIGSLMDADPRLAVVLADISVGYFGAAAASHPHRVIKAGIMEQTAVSLAAGLALEGFIPVVHSIAPFVVERPFEQIKDDFCYQRLGGNFISIGASYDYGTDGMTHYGMGDVPILRTLPGMEIVVPGTAAEFDALFRERYADGAPTYFRLQEQGNASDRRVRFGQLEILRRGSAAVVVAVGPMLDRVLEATLGLDVGVVYCTTASPFDGATLRAVATDAGTHSIVLVEPYYEGTLVPDVVRAFGREAVRIEAIGVPHRILSRYGTAAEHDRDLGLDADGIHRRIVEFLAVG